jgi:hypothetical protein
MATSQSTMSATMLTAQSLNCSSNKFLKDGKQQQWIAQCKIMSGNVATTQPHPSGTKHSFQPARLMRSPTTTQQCMTASFFTRRPPDAQTSLSIASKFIATNNLEVS